MGSAEAVEQSPVGPFDVPVQTENLGDVPPYESLHEPLVMVGVAPRLGDERRSYPLMFSSGRIAKTSMKAAFGAVSIVKQHELDVVCTDVHGDGGQLVEIRRQRNELRHDHVVRRKQLLTCHRQTQLPRQGPGLRFSA